MSTILLSGPFSAHLLQRQTVSILPSLQGWAAHSLSASEAGAGLSRGYLFRAAAPVLRASSSQAVSEQTIQEPDIRTVLDQVRNSSNTDAENRYREGSEYLRSLGFNSSADILRILDVAMNPNSLYSPYADKRRSYNSSARPLSVEHDMRPVVAFMEGHGMAKQGIKQVISEHPPVLCYSLEQRLKPLFEYLKEMGIEQPGKTIQARPTLLGLEADKNLRKIVDYLQHNEYTQDQIISFMESSL